MNTVLKSTYDVSFLLSLLFSRERERGIEIRVRTTCDDDDAGEGSDRMILRFACPFHRRTAALENLRSNCIVRDSGGHSQRYWRLWYVYIYILFSLAPGKQLVYARPCVPLLSSSSRNFVHRIILKCLVTSTFSSTHDISYYYNEDVRCAKHRSALWEQFPRGSIRTRNITPYPVSVMDF